MNKIAIKKNRVKSYLTPSSWEELKASDYIAVVKYIIDQPQPIYERLDDLLVLTAQLFAISKKNMMLLLDDVIEQHQLYEFVSPVIEFLYVPFDEIHMPDWKLEKLKIGKRTFYGPQDKFRYMKFGEFISADVLFMAYLKYNDERLLNRLIAVLYRAKSKQKKDGDVREDFASETLDKRQKHIAKLSNDTKRAIVFNYATVRQYITKQYPFVFAGGKSNSEEQELTEGWRGIRHQLAEKVMNLEKIDDTYVSEIFSWYNREIKERKNVR